MARNEITGDVLSNHKGDKELYDTGWDRIFKNKAEDPSEPPTLYKIGSDDWYNELMARAQTAWSGESIEVPQGLDAVGIKAFILSHLPEPGPFEEVHPMGISAGFGDGDESMNCFKPYD